MVCLCGLHASVIGAGSVLLLVAWVAWLACVAWLGWVACLCGLCASVSRVAGVLTWVTCYYYC